MYKVLIVEDEILVRNGLKSSVEWSAYNMEIAADLPDGQTAWDYCLREGFPDLIVTDIRMPKMDGMQLIANVRKHNKSSRIVVLSCLEEFELVRQAMSLGVSNYILKLTMTEEEIGRVLDEVRLELDARNSFTRDPSKIKPAPANLDLLKEKYMKDFLFYGIYSAEEFEQFTVQNGMRLSPVRLVACTMEIDRYFALKRKFEDKQGHLIKMTMLNLLQEMTATYGRGEATFLEDTRYLLLFSFDDLVSEQAIMQELRSILDGIKGNVQTCFKGSVTFGISGIKNGYSSLRKLYFESVRTLEKKFILGPGQVHAGSSPANLKQIHEKAEGIRRFSPLREMLNPFKQAEFDEYMDDFVGALPGEKKATRIILYQFLQWLNTNLYNDHQNEETLIFNITETLDECDNLPDMLDHVMTYIAKVTEQSRNYLQMSGEVTKAVQFIKMNFDQNISLQQVADHVDLSFGYLSNLIKKELGVTFVEYLNCYRIERAKELLTNTHLKSYDVAVKVGFSPEYTYFSKVFKKVTGLNPNEYRRQCQLGPGASG